MIEEEISVLKQEMAANANPTKAVNMATYLKNKFNCFGIKSPVHKEIQKKWLTRIKPQKHNHWDVIYNLWALDEREFHYIAIDYLNKTPKAKIAATDHKNLEELITTHSWWDSVDSIASNYVGKYFQAFPEKRDEVIKRWSQSDNMWLNRTCLIFQLKYKDDVDFELLKELIKQFQPDKQFFIQKAIGWSLRQYSKFNSKAVADFINEIELTGLARREASKYI